MGISSKKDQAAALKAFKEDFQLSGRLDDTRDKYKMEKRFVYLDDQWEPQAKARRKREERPLVTINTSRQYIQQVANNVRKNPPAMHVIPIGDGAEMAEAVIREDMLRGIQRDSDAEEAFIHGIEDAAAGGYGIAKLEPEYESEDSFLQVLKVKRVMDASTCRIDPRARESDFSDMRFFIEQIPYTANQLSGIVGADKAAEIKEFLKLQDGKNQEMWGNKKTPMLINHWRVELTPDTLYHLQDGKDVFESDGPLDMESVAVGNDGKPVCRPSYKKKITWRRLIGEKVISELIWPGDSIPVAIFVGQQVVIEDTTQFVSLTRPLIDEQRIRNFARSNQVELMATSPKARFMATLESIPEEMRPMWETAHKENWRVLYHQQFDERDRELRPPIELPPIGPDSGLTEEIAICDAEAHQVTGRYEESQGQMSNADSGRAIGLKQETGLTATVHFEHNGSVAIKYLANCTLQAIPYYYDTDRRVSAVAKDGTARIVRINAEDIDEKGKAYHHKITDAKYTCAVTVGPSYATKLLQSADILKGMLQALPQAGAARPDLVIKTMGTAMGWNETQEWVESMKALIPPVVQQHLDAVKEEDGGPQISPQVAQQMAQMQQSLQMQQAQLQAVAPEMERLKKDNELNWFKAETDRIKALADVGITGNQAILDAHVELEKAHIAAAGAHSTNMVNAHMQAIQQPVEPKEPA